MTKFKNRNVFAAAIVAALLLGMFLSDANADLVSHWAFDEDAGATTAVASDTYYNATPSNGVTFGSTGVFGNAVHFDGTASNNLAFNKVDSMYSGDFTYATWVSLETLTSGAQFYGDWSNPWAFRFFYDNETANKGYVGNARNRDNDNDLVSLKNNAAWATNTWYHVATVFDNTNGLALNYINGTLVSTQAFTTDAPRKDNSASGRLHHFGWKQDSANQVMKGMLDETYIYDNPLSAAEVRNLMRYNNLAGPVNNDTRFSANSIPIEGLFSSLIGQSLDEAMATYTAGAKASKINLGITHTREGNNLSFAGTQDMTGTGSAFYIENLGVGGLGYSTGIENSRVGGNAYSMGGVATGFGIHADAYFTLDIAELRAAGAIGADEILHFTSHAGVRPASGAGSINAAIIMWDENNVPLAGYVNGNLIEIVDNGGVYQFVGAYGDYTPLTHATYATFDFALPENTRYMTIISADGDNSKSSDHTVFAGAKLSLDMGKSIYLNQLFGQGATPQRLNYAHSLNTGVLPVAGTDLGIVKAQTNWGGKLDLLGDSSGVVFNTSDLAVENAATSLYIKSNMCGYDTITSFMTTGQIIDGAIGMHANSMMTFDLDALRDYNGWGDSVLQFSTTADMLSCGGSPTAADIYSLILLFDETDVLSAYLQGVEVDVKNNGGVWSLADSVDLNDFDLVTTTDGAEVDIDFDIGTNAKYMTLMLLAGESSNSDHGLYLNPLLGAAGSSDSAVPEPATWLTLLIGLAGLLAARKRRGA